MAVGSLSRMTERLDIFATPYPQGLATRTPRSSTPNVLEPRYRKQQLESHPGLQRSNIGGWHSDTDMAAWGRRSRRATLADFAVNTASSHMVDMAPGGKRQFTWSIEMWANVTPPGCSNQLHCHPAAYWSGVYYPDPGGSEIEGNGGELLLEDPRYPMAYMTVPELLLRDENKDPMQSQFACGRWPVVS